MGSGWIALASLALLALTTLAQSANALLRGWQTRKDTETALQESIKGDASMAVRMDIVDKKHEARWAEHDRTCERRDREIERRFEEVKKLVDMASARASDSCNEVIIKLGERTAYEALLSERVTRTEERIDALSHMIDRRTAMQTHDHGERRRNAFDGTDKG